MFPYNETNNITITFFMRNYFSFAFEAFLSLLKKKIIDVHFSFYRNILDGIFKLNAQ